MPHIPTQITIVAAGTPIYCPVRDTYLSPEDWTDENGVERHSVVRQGGVRYMTAAGAAALASTEMRVAA